MRMLRRLVHIEHGGKTHICPFHQFTPRRSRFRRENSRYFRLQQRPLFAVHLGIEGCIVNIAKLQQQRIKLRFDGPDRHEFAIRTRVGIVEMRAAAKHARASFARPRAERLIAVDHRAEQRGAFDHRGIDHLALARSACFHQRAQHTKREHHATTAKIAEQIQRRHRRCVAAPELVQHPAHRDVIQIVPRSLGERSILPPARHAAVHNFRIAFQAHVRPKT